MLGKVMAKNMLFNGRTVTFIVRSCNMTIYRADIHLDGLRTCPCGTSTKSEKFDAICEKVLDMAAEESGFERSSLKPINIDWEAKND